MNPINCINETAYLITILTLIINTFVVILFIGFNQKVTFWLLSIILLHLNFRLLESLMAEKFINKCLFLEQISLLIVYIVILNMVFFFNYRFFLSTYFFLCLIRTQTSISLCAVLPVFGDGVFMHKSPLEGRLFFILLSLFALNMLIKSLIMLWNSRKMYNKKKAIKYLWRYKNLK